MKVKDIVYKRPDFKQVKAEMEKAIERIGAANSETVIDEVAQFNLLNNHLISMRKLSSIRHSIDTRDDFYSKETDYWDSHGPLYDDCVNHYYRVLLASPFQEELRAHFPKTLFLIAKNKLTVCSDKTIDLRTKENQLISAYGNLLGGAEVEFNGEKLTLPQLERYYQSKDRSIRKAATLVYSQFLEKNENEFDRIYDELVNVRTEMAHLLGYNNYVEMAYVIMNRFDYSREMLEGYRKEVLASVVPLTQKLYGKQAIRLGVDELKNYDLMLESMQGNAIPLGGPDEIMKQTVAMYQAMSKETNQFIDTLVKQELFDVLSQPGKQGGAYCSYLPTYQMPFVFMNFNGTFNDVNVLTHEMGHGFQVYQSRWIKQPECLFPTLDSCEIHSMSMEFFTWPWMHLFFGERVDKYYYSHLSAATKILPYGVLVDHFQHEIYENPTLTPDQRKKTWRSLEQLYCPERDYSEDTFQGKGTYWYYQGHIFGSPFYYIDYTLAQFCAFQFWKRDYVEKDPTAWMDYLKICNAGGTNTFLDSVKSAGLRSPFEEGALTEMVGTLDTYLDQLAKSAFNN